MSSPVSDGLAADAPAAGELSAGIIARLTGAGLRIAVAESLTGGLLVAELIRTPGASAVVSGGVVAYDTALKSSVLGVDAALLRDHGAVDARVAAQMAQGVRAALAIGGRPADIGVATTGVAGPDPLDGAPVGRVVLAISTDRATTTERHDFTGDRDTIRHEAVRAALALIDRDLAHTSGE